MTVDDTVRVGAPTFALSERQFLSGERAATSLRVNPVDAVELVLFP
jgi:hypothetical protein